MRRAVSSRLFARSYERRGDSGGRRRTALRRWPRTLPPCAPAACRVAFASQPSADSAPLTARGAPDAARRPRDSQVAIGAWAPADAALIYIIRESV